jgi:hypothetical protein
MDRMSSYVRVIALIGVAGLALGSAGCLAAALGCAGAAAAGGGYVYLQGNNYQLYAASFDDSWAAAKTALTDLGMPIQEEKRENGTGFLRSQTTDGETVRINLEPEPSKFPADRPQTRVCVRVGVFGDHPASVRVFDQIGTHLTPVAPRITPAASSSWSAVPPGAPPTTLPPPTAPPPLLEPEPVSRTAASR